MSDAKSRRALPKALIAWSSGKDSAWALHEARAAGEYDIVGALTTVTDSFARVSMHGVREELLMAQLDAAGLPAMIVRIPYPCPNEIYEREMAKAIGDAKARGVTHIIFGDLYLEDIRAYREKKLAGTGITPVFPLWQKPTDAAGARHDRRRRRGASRRRGPEKIAGRVCRPPLRSPDCSRDLPAGIDPCGENGEFHSFVSAGRCWPQDCGAGRRNGGARRLCFADLLASS